MTILEVTARPFDPRFRGGGERYPSVIARELARHEEVVVAYCDKPSRARGDAALILPSRTLEIRPFVDALNPLPTFGTLRTIRDYLDGHKGEIEFLHVHNLRTAMSTTWLVLTALRRTGRSPRILLTDHSSRFFPFPRWSILPVDYFAAVSEHSLRQLQGWARRPGVVVPPPVPTDLLERAHRPGFADRGVDLLFFGRLVPWKRPDLVLRLARELVARIGRPVTVVLAGSGADQPFVTDLKRWAGNRRERVKVSFVTDPDDDQVAELFSSSRLLVSLSMRVDAYGRRYATPELGHATAIEAGAFGTPAVLSNLPGVVEQVIDDVTGLIADPAHLDRMPERVATLLADPSAWERLSRNAERMVRHERTPQAVVEKLRRFLEQIRAGEV